MRSGTDDDTRRQGRYDPFATVQCPRGDEHHVENVINGWSATLGTICYNNTRPTTAVIVIVLWPADDNNNNIIIKKFNFVSCDVPPYLGHFGVFHFPRVANQTIIFCRAGHTTLRCGGGCIR